MEPTTRTVWAAVRPEPPRAGVVACGLVALGALVLTGCSGPAAEVTEFRGEAQEVSLGSLTAADVATAQTVFGVELLHALCQEDPGRNVVVSPTSAAEALGLLLPAARGETEAALADLLGLPVWSADLTAALAAHTAALAGLAHDGDLDAEDAPDSLRISNRVWLREGLEPEPGYLDATATAFDAGAASADFVGDPEGATDRINEAVARDTAGLVDPLFDDPVPPRTVAVLTNAVHLKARWATPFLSVDPEPFDAVGGEVTAQMMRGGAGTLREVDGWSAVELPYRDGTLSAVAVLPPAGADPCAVDATVLGGLTEGVGDEVDVAMPALSLEQGHALLDLLADLGLPVAGDYSGLGMTDLEITDVVQKVVLEVDQDGTEAAAATGVVVGEAAGLVRPTVVMDRPYLLVLTDVATRSPLFLTVVHDPS